MDPCHVTTLEEAFPNSRLASVGPSFSQNPFAISQSQARVVPDVGSFQLSAAKSGTPLRRPGHGRL